jgi:hypothetical protein
MPSGLTPNNPIKEAIMTTQEKLIRRKLTLIEAPGIGNELSAYAGYIPQIFNI